MPGRGPGEAPMAGFLARRFVYFAVLIALATSVAYVLAATQLNPRSNFAGRNPPPAPEVVDAKLDAVNMNNHRPLILRVGHWANGVVHGDLGRTIDGGSVNDELGRRMRVSLRLLLAGSTTRTLVGVALGAYGAVKQYRLGDHVLTVAAFVLLSVPIVVLAV